jgi:uncharacterized protein (TIGR00369 family)
MTATLGEEAVARIRSALQSQGFTRLLGAEVDEVGAGYLAMSLPARAELMQQHGFFHGGAIAYLVDNCTTAAAATMLAPGHGVLTAEYKLNIVSPATGDRLFCRAEVVKPGRMLTVVQAKVFACRGEARKLVAVALATIANLPPERAPAAATAEAS